MSPMETHNRFARPLWAHDEPLARKRLIPKLIVNTGFDLKSFIRPESAPCRSSSDYQHMKESHDQAGGTRWNPTQEQIGILEMLYRSGMRTPNAHQIDQITAQLAKYGKIEGKNVFYWFQNHKARERQKQKRKRLGLTHTPPTPSSSDTTTALQLSPPAIASGVGEGLSDCALYKRKCKSWPAFEQGLQVNEEEVENRTLKLFPLHPEGRHC